MATQYALHLGTPPNTILVGSLAYPFPFLGPWVATTFYPQNSVVSSGGNFYQAKAPNTNVATSVTATWKLLAVGGATTTGQSFAVPQRQGLGKQAPSDPITWEVVTTCTALTVNLEGSIDNVNWFTLDTYTTAAGGNALQVVTNNPVDFVRAHITSTDSGTTVVMVQL